MPVLPVRAAGADARDGGRAVRGSARGGALNLVGAAVAAVAQLAAVVVVTRSAGQEVAGGIFAGVSVLLIGAAVAQLGTDVSLVRHVSACLAMQRRRDAVTVVRDAVLAVGLSGLLLAASGVLAGGWAAEHLGADARATAVLVVGMPFLALHELFLAITRGTGSMRATVGLERVARPVLQLGLLVSASITFPGTPEALALAWVAPWALVLPFSTVAAVRAVRSVDGGGEPVATTGRSAFWRFSATRAGSRACQVALQRADIIIVAALAGASAAAVYTAATRFLVLGQLVATAVQQAAQPFFAGLHTAGDTRSLQDLLRRTTVWSVALVWPAYLVMAVCAAPLLSLFGDGYERGATSLVVLSVAMLAATAAGPVDVVLQMAGRGGTSLAITAAALVVDVVVCLLLVPRFGLLGAAVAWATAILLRNAATVMAVRSSPGVTAGSPGLLRVAGQALLVIAVPSAAAVAVGVPVSVLTAVVTMAATAYLGLLWRDLRRYGLDLVLRR